VALKIMENPLEFERELTVRGLALGDKKEHQAQV
jgi:hypothetical protein